MTDNPEPIGSAQGSGSRAADTTAAHYQRNESEPQRIDRNWNELLQEIRVLQTGAQILAAFLIVLPFQARFPILDDFQTGWYLGLLTVALLVVVLLLAPVSMHRTLFRRLVKDEMVRAANRILKVALAFEGILLAGVAVLIFDVVLGRIAGICAGVGMFVIVFGLLAVLPRRVYRRG